MEMTKQLLAQKTDQELKDLFVDYNKQFLDLSNKIDAATKERTQILNLLQTTHEHYINRRNGNVYESNGDNNVDESNGDNNVDDSNGDNNVDDSNGDNNVDDSNGDNNEPVKWVFRKADWDSVDFSRIYPDGNGDNNVDDSNGGNNDTSIVISI